MNKHVITIVIVAIVFGGAGFFGGLKYDQAKAAGKDSASNAAGQRQFGQNGGGGGRFRLGAGGGNFVAGQILNKDSQSITVQLPNGNGSKLVFYSASTNISKTASGTPDDLKTGENVLVTGTANSSDGSLTAQSITLGGAFMRGAPAGGPSATSSNQ